MSGRPVVAASTPPVGSPVLGCESVVLMPHGGGQMRDGLPQMGEMTVETCRRALRREPPLYPVS